MGAESFDLEVAAGGVHEVGAERGEAGDDDDAAVFAALAQVGDQLAEALRVAVPGGRIGVGAGRLEPLAGAVFEERLVLLRQRIAGLRSFTEVADRLHSFTRRGCAHSLDTVRARSLPSPCSRS